MCGDARCSRNLQQRFDKEVVRQRASNSSTPSFRSATRHKRMGETRYLVEPNIKDGKGGLRDLNTLFWIAKYFYRVSNRVELVGKGVLSAAPNTTSSSSARTSFGRCAATCISTPARPRNGWFRGAARDGRTAWLQGHAGPEGVERFMKHYFLIAKDVGDLTRIFCAALEEEEVKQAPSFNRLLQTLPFSAGRARSGHATIS
jgi:[protein-PII] uridylyltransferase